MRQLNHLGPLALATVALAACSGHGQQSQARPATEACALPGVGSASQPWQLVRTANFTFCVPASWEVNAAGASNGREGVSWSLGSPPPPVQVTMRETIPASQVNRRLEELRQNSCSAPQATTETVGEQNVELSRTQCGSRFLTRALWHATALYFTGSASSPAAADEQLAIYRTVRLVPAR